MITELHVLALGSRSVKDQRSNVATSVVGITSSAGQEVVRLRSGEWRSGESRRASHPLIAAGTLALTRRPERDDLRGARTHANTLKLAWRGT